MSAAPFDVSRPRARFTSLTVGNRRGRLGGGCGGTGPLGGGGGGSGPAVNGRTTPITATATNGQIHHTEMAFVVASPPAILAMYTPIAIAAPLKNTVTPTPKRGESRNANRRRFAPDDRSFLPTLPSVRAFDREHTGCHACARGCTACPLSNEGNTSSTPTTIPPGCSGHSVGVTRVLRPPTSTMGFYRVSNRAARHSRSNPRKPRRCPVTRSGLDHRRCARGIHSGSRHRQAD